MFQNNPLFVEKLVQTKQEDIMREIRRMSTYDFRDQHEFFVEPQVKYKIGMLVGLLIALGWLFGVIN